MKIQTVNNSVSGRGLYFPSFPKGLVVRKPELKEAISKNKYISNLAIDKDVFAYFAEKDMADTASSHILRLDIAEKATRDITSSYVYTSKMNTPDSIKNISAKEFINLVQEPIVPAKTFFGRIIQIIKHPNNIYYNFIKLQ